jgi:hypothetical protein
MQNEKNVICSFFLLVIVSVNAQLKETDGFLPNKYKNGEYHQWLISVSF